MKLIFTLLLGLSALYGFSKNDSQKISVLSFSEFEPYLHFSNDTTYVLNFWATWCVPCRMEMPELEKINSELKASKVKVILVSLDFVNQIEKSLLPYLEKNEIKSKVVLLNAPDPNTWINKVDSSWSGAIPATLIYNKSKKVFLEKQISFEEISQLINEKF